MGNGQSEGYACKLIVSVVIGLVSAPTGGFHARSSDIPRRSLWVWPKCMHFGEHLFLLSLYFGEHLFLLFGAPLHFGEHLFLLVGAPLQFFELVL